MKLKFFIPIIIFSMVFSSCAQNVDEQAASEVASYATQDATTETVVNTEDEESITATSETSISSQDIYAPYDKLIADIYDGICKWIRDGEDVSEELNVSWCITRGHKDYEIAGYTRMDIDGDGIDELLLGENDPEGIKLNIDARDIWDSIIYDIFTIKDGELVHVATGGERTRYYLYDNGLIVNEEACGALHCNWSIYEYKDCKLNIQESRSLDGMDNDESGRFYRTNKEPYEDETEANRISEEEFDQAIEKISKSYKYIEFTPFYYWS